MTKALGRQVNNLADGAWRLTIADLTLPAMIGVYDSEQGAPQPIALTIDIDCDEAQTPPPLDHAAVEAGVRAIVGAGHIKLVETLAEKVAAFCLDFEGVTRAAVSVSKPHAIEEANAAGVRIVRSKPHEGDSQPMT